MRIVDDLIFSPSEIVPEREEFSLSEMGLSVLAFQVSEMGTDATKSRGARGPVVVATTPKERVATLTLAVKGDADASLATAAYRLQQKLGQIEEVGDWLKRVPCVGDFAGPVACQVKREVSLGNMGQWQAGECPDVTFQFLIGSEWYDVEEEEVEVEVEQVGRATIVEIPPSRGTTRGLERFRFKNEGEEDLRGLIYAKECRDAPADLEDPTALLAYNCADLTPSGGASVKTVSGLEVVEAPLASGWITILDSEIDGVGHMMHAGGRRPSLRVQNPEEADAQLRLRYRSLGATAWEENKITPIPHHGGSYQYYDMGQMRTLLAKLGDQRLQFQILGRALSGVGKVRLHQVYPAPDEQYMRISQPYEAQAADAQSTKSPGTIANDSLFGTKDWSGLENVKTSNDTRATAAGTDVKTKLLKVTNLGFSLPEDATDIFFVVAAEVSAGKGTVYDYKVLGVKAGEVIPPPDELHDFDPGEGEEGGTSPEPWPSTDTHRYYGPTRFFSPWTPAEVSSSGFGVAIAAELVGEAEARIDHITISAYWSSSANEDRLCFASRSAELRSEDVVRQHPTDDVWGLLSPYATCLPYDPPGAIEGRPSRAILIPSQGDLDELPDVGSADIAVESYLRRPAYHLAREAAA